MDLASSLSESLDEKYTQMNMDSLDLPTHIELIVNPKLEEKKEVVESNNPIY